MFARIAALVLACYVLVVSRAPDLAGATFSWQEAYAKVLPRGDLEWTPMPFRFEKGASPRYIDFDGGNDENEGTTSQAPWKHHPWDAQATGKAKACTGIHTYVFKGGVAYRGELVVREAGKAGDPIRLTRDPSWGQGPAVLCGSERVTGWKKGTEHKDIPEPEQVWWADLDFAPRSVWLVRKEGDFLRIPLARTPNWKRSNPDDLKSEWWVWDNPGKPFGNTIKSPSGQQVHLGVDTKHIKDKPEDYFKGALIWPEFGWVMSQPYPTQVEVVDLKQHGLGFAGWTGGGANGIIMRNMRYYLEDKPQYLDDPDGEFWFEKKGAGGRLYLRLPGDADPNAARVEVGKRPSLVNGEKVEHLDISGLTFRFTPSMWDLTSAPWDFSTTPWGSRAELHPGCVRVWGSGKGIRVANCLFEHVFHPIRIKSLVDGQRVDDVRIEDNEFRHTDNGILSVDDGSGWGYAKLRGRLGDVRVYRNRSFQTGMRPARYSSGTGIRVTGARTVEIAGNIIERSGAQGIDVHGAKTDGMWGDVPFTRILIHHNKVWESMLNCNDYGGIETWQGGPAYVFDNLSYNAQGYRNWGHASGNDPGFGHAYYLDGAFKNYHFNNIAWGKSKDVTSPLVNCAAFQEIISYQNTFFQNTAYNFYEGSRRQEPSAGRNKYLANIWDGMGKYVFRHSDPARTEAAGNERDAGPRRNRYALDTNVYGRNVFYDFAAMGVLEPSGRWLRTFDDFKGTLEKNKGLLSELGEVSKTSPLRDPAKGDFRPVPGSAGTGKGVKVFVPWSLSGVVGEWNFYPAANDPTRLIDEHWYMTDYHVSRDTYHQRPMYPLKAVNVTREDYVKGELEDWIPGALSFSPGKKQYATLAHAEMMKPFSFRDLKKSRHEGARPEQCTIEGEALKNPQVYGSNLLIEVYFKTAPGHTGGVLMEKMKGNGYSLTVGAAGKLSFYVQGVGASAVVESTVRVNDGRWHHGIVEADRHAKKLTVYVDGKKVGSAEGIDASVSLANDDDVYVGGTWKGRYLEGALDFLRIAQGTLADADTTIEELYAWEFDGPQTRDFTGRKPTGARSAGAIDLAPPTPIPLGSRTVGGQVMVAAMALPHLHAGGDGVQPATARQAQAPDAVKAEPGASPALARDTGTFELRVVGPDGKPIPAAEVELRTRPVPAADQIRQGKFLKKNSYGVTAATDAAGRLVLNLSKTTRGFDVLIETPGYGPYRAGWSSEIQTSLIPASLTAELEAGWAVGGVVVDGDGKPIAGARVRPSIKFKNRPGDHSALYVGTDLKSDAAGTWHYDSVPTSMKEVAVEINHSAFMPKRPSLPRSGFGIERGKRPAGTIVLDRGLTVTGKVTDTEGRPIAGALLRTKFLNDLREARTGDDGMYRLSGCEPRMARIVVSAKGRATDMQETRIGPEMGPVDFQMKPGGRIRVRVLDEQGNPLPKARIFFQQWRGAFEYFEFNHVSQYADAQGVWEWNEAPLDEFKADICPPDGMNLGKQSLIARDEEYVFRTPAALVVSGKVVDAATGLPIKRFQVVRGVRSGPERMNWVRGERLIATDGQYRIRQTQDYFAHLVRIEAEGYQAAVSRDVKSNEGNVTIDFALRKAEDVAATVRTPDGMPAAKARVALGVAGSQISVLNGAIDEGSTYADRRDTDDAGTFRFPPQDAAFQLVITHPAGFAHVKATAGSVPKTIELKAWARVEGIFRVGDKPVPEVPITINSVAVHSYGPDVASIFTHHDRTTGKDGRFVFDRVFPGHARVGRRIMLTVNDGAAEATSSCMTAVNLPAGQTTRVDLGGTGRPVVGRLQPPAGFQGKVNWNFALIHIQRDLPSPPSPAEPPIPAAAQRDPAKRAAWWLEWQQTDAGRAWTAWQVAADRMHELRAASPSFTATAGRDGAFRVDDMPGGLYVLSVHFSRDAPGVLSAYRFSVPPLDTARSDAKLNLGTLSLKNQ